MATLPGSKQADSFFLRLRPIHRLLIGCGAALLTFIFIRAAVESTLVLIMIMWDVLCVTILLTAWIVFFTCPPARIRKIASQEDGSRVLVFFFVLLSSMASMGIVVVLINADEFSTQKALYLVVCIMGMLLSWCMVHTTFSFHYAYMYYDDDAAAPEKHAEGLDFPKEKAPDYLDFAYFAFVIGMTFQVSDVQITSRSIRRKALAHGLLSFALNTFVVALTVNIIAGMKKG
ncbi:MAG TPA: DUF1345 domain-containing protein [Chitinophagaceae bacterium]|nr:DUF1345 domain-containing protein [Chitinophagaceae bacterium]